MGLRMDAAFADHSSLNIGIPLLEPYATKLENGTLSGVYPEISREIAKRAGLKIKLEASPLARMWLQFSGGQYDIMYALPNEEHGRHGRHLADLFNLQIIAVARKDIRVCRISDLKNNVVGTLRRVAYRPRQDQVPAENLRSANSYDQLVRMLSVARIDAIIGTDLSIIHLFKKYDLTPDELSRPLSAQNSPGLCLWQPPKLPSGRNRPICSKGQGIYREKVGWAGPFWTESRNMPMPAARQNVPTTDQ